MNSSCLELNGPDAMFNSASDEVSGDISGNELAEQNTSKRNAVHRRNDLPPLFIFTETQGGPLHVRDSGIPELVPFRISMDPEPTWLDNLELVKGSIYEEKDGISFWNKSLRELYVLFYSPVKLTVLF